MSPTAAVYSHRHRSTQYTHQKDTHNKLLAQGGLPESVWAPRGDDVVSKAETVAFPRVSGTCVVHILHTGGMTPKLNVRGGDIKEAAGTGFIAWRAPVCWEACGDGVFTVSV